jgi:hypothetical protein
MNEQNMGLQDMGNAMGINEPQSGPEKVTDNFFKDFPARMADGRFITNYLPNCQQNLAYQGGMTSWQYRAYLTKMADEIRDFEFSINKELYGCKDCHKDKGIGHRFDQLCNENGCHFKEINPDGLGVKKVT